MTKKFKFNAVSTLVLSLLTFQAHAGRLEPELRNMIESHPAIKATQLASQAAKDRFSASKGAYFPKVILSADTGKEDITTTSYSQGVPSTTPIATELNRKKASLMIEQSLFNGQRREASVDLAGIENSLQQINYEIQTQDVLMEAVSAYLLVGRYQTLIGLAKLNEQKTQQQIDFESKRVQGGAGVAMDVLQARSRLQIVRERRVLYEQGLRDAAANYEQVFGRPPVMAEIQDFALPDAQLPANIVAALQRGMATNPRLKTADLFIDRANKSIHLEKSALAPTIDLVAMSGSERNVNQLAKKVETSLLLKFNWVLFSGGDTTNRISAAVKDREEQEARQSIMANKIKEAIRMNWNQLINSSERLELLDSAARIAKEVMEDRKRLRDAGKETAITVLDAEVEYYGVLGNKVNALYDKKISSFRLLSSLGELTIKNLGLDGQFSIPVKALAVDLSQIEAPARK